MRSALSAFVVIYAVVLLARSSPLGLDSTPQQQPLSTSTSTGRPQYENGELPPREDTEGWIDPRLNGGRFLDVRVWFSDSRSCGILKLDLCKW